MTLVEVPRDEYESRLRAARERLKQTDAVHARLALLRLAVFIGAAVLAWYALWTLWFAPLLFLVLVVLQAQAARRRRFAERSIRYYELGIARIDDQWAGKGETGERFRDATHPYADDLDLFGTGSLFELLSTARTWAGEAQPCGLVEIAGRWRGVASPAGGGGRTAGTDGFARRVGGAWGRIFGRA